MCTMEGVWFPEVKQGDNAQALAEVCYTKGFVCFSSCFITCARSSSSAIDAIRGNIKAITTGDIDISDGASRAGGGTTE